MTHRSRGFTLVELLLVVALISLLISLLLPALGRARDITDGTICATHMKQWSTALWSYGSDNTRYFPDNRDTGTTPDLVVGGQHVSWNSSVVQKFWREYLEPLSEKAKTDQLDTLNCPTQKWHQINDISLGGGLVGYFYLPHRTPTNINYNHADGGNGDFWVSRKRLGGPYNHAPVLIDMNQYGKWNTSWYYNTSVPYSSHVGPEGKPEYQNMLFESGDVRRFPSQSVGLGAEMGGWLMYYDPF